MDLAEKILNGWTMTKPQRTFLLTLFTTILALRGKVTFRNLSRYSGWSARRLLVFDPGFIPKAGKHTPDLGYFWNGCHGRAEKGLEVSTFSLIDLEHHTGYALSVRQTPAPTDRRRDDETLIDAYWAHLHTVAPTLHPEERHIAVDGQLANKKWLDGVEAVGLHTIGKLRCDANMRFFYTGPRRVRGSGRQKTYDGKVDWKDQSRFDYITEQDGLKLYTQVLNHVSFKRTLQVVVLDQRQAQQDDQPMVYSVASVKADYFNECFLHRIFYKCGWNVKSIKKSPLYKELREYGRIAA